MIMQIGHYKTCATMIKNEFIKTCQDLRINPAEAAIVMRVLPRDLRIYDRLVLWYYTIKAVTHDATSFLGLVAEKF